LVISKTKRMKSRFLPYQDGDSILNYYALPLVGLSKDDFGPNFIVTKINHAGTSVFVQVKEDIYSDTIHTNKIVSNDLLFLVYSVPEEFLSDISLILKGKYSQISSKAKQIISTKSGLFFNTVGSDGHKYTSKLIFALHKDEELRNYMFDALRGSDKHNDELFETLHKGELTEKLDSSDFIENI